VKTLLLAAPLSGAVSGIEAVTRLTLAAPLPWRVLHLDTATVRRNQQRGCPTPRGVYLMGKMVLDMYRLTRHAQVDAVVVQAAKNRLGFLKAAALFFVARHTHARVVMKHGGDHFDRFYGWLSEPSRRLVSHVLNGCDVILVEAECLRRQFCSIVQPDKIRHAYLGIDAIPPHLPYRDPARSPHLLYVGHVSRAKGAVDLLQAMPFIQAQHPDVRLTMLGEHIRKERSVLHIEDADGAWRAVKVRRHNVDMPGLVVGAEKAKAFRRADVFVFPSYSEGFPVAVLEAMAAGLPIVATPVGALPEVLVEGQHCLFAPIGSPAQLADRVNEVLAWSPARRAMMGYQNWLTVRERFTLQHYAEGLVRAIGDVVEG